MKNFLFLVFVCIFCTVTGVASASSAELYLQTSTSRVSPGDTFNVAIRLHSNNQEINAVETTLYYRDFLKMVQTKLQDSFISFWIKGPAEVASTKPGYKAISLSGVSPSGIAVAGSPVATFAFTFPDSSKSTAPLLFSLESARVLLNDGRGSSAELKTKNATLQVVEEVQKSTSTPIVLEAIPKDLTPPDTLSVAVAQNKNVFNNRWFVAFNAVDKESGIAYYEIQESLKSEPDSEKWVKAKNPTELSDQTLKSYIFVRATDYSGNTKVAVVEPKEKTSAQSYQKYLFWCILLLILFALLQILFFRKKPINPSHEKESGQ